MHGVGVEGFEFGGYAGSAFAASSVGDEPEDRGCPVRLCTRFYGPIPAQAVSMCPDGLCACLRPGFVGLGGIWGHAVCLSTIPRMMTAGSSALARAAVIASYSSGSSQAACNVTASTIARSTPARIAAAL